MESQNLKYDIIDGVKITPDTPVEKVFEVMQQARLFYLAALRDMTMLTQFDTQDLGETLKSAERVSASNDEVVVPIYSLSDEFRCEVMEVIGEIYIEYISRLFMCFRVLVEEEMPEGIDSHSVFVERLKRFLSRVSNERSMSVFNKTMKYWNASAYNFCDDEDNVLDANEDLAYLRAGYSGVEIKIDNSFTLFLGYSIKSERLLVCIVDRTGTIRIAHNTSDAFCNFSDEESYPSKQFAFFSLEHLDLFEVEFSSRL